MHFFTLFTKGYRALRPPSNENDDQSPSHDDSGTIWDEAKTHRVRFWMSTLNTALLSLCLLSLIVVLLKVNGIERSPESRLSPSNSDTFATHLGRDTAYMTLDHEYDSLWDVMLVEHLGEFETPADQYKRGEYSM